MPIRDGSPDTTRFNAVTEQGNDQDKYYILICGTRTELNYEHFCSYIEEVCDKLSIENAEIVSGGCKGVDLLGERFAQDHDFAIKQFLPDWKCYGRAAGIIRNRAMVDYIRSKPHALVIAFWDGESHGTKSTIQYARKCQIDVYVVDYRSRPCWKVVRLNADSNDKNTTSL